MSDPPHVAEVVRLQFVSMAPEVLRRRLRWFAAFLLLSAVPVFAEEVRIATFNVDATPAVGTPVAYAPVREILDPLSARGIVLLGADKPVVLCAVDWIGIGNVGYDAWRERLAEAAGTTPDHVAVHTTDTNHTGTQSIFPQHISDQQNRRLRKALPVRSDPKGNRSRLTNSYSTGLFDRRC